MLACGHGESHMKAAECLYNGYWDPSCCGLTLADFPNSVCLSCLGVYLIALRHEIFNKICTLSLGTIDSLITDEFITPDVDYGADEPLILIYEFANRLEYPQQIEKFEWLLQKCSPEFIRDWRTSDNETLLHIVLDSSLNLDSYILDWTRYMIGVCDLDPNILKRESKFKEYRGRVSLTQLAIEGIYPSTLEYLLESGANLDIYEAREIFGFRNPILNLLNRYRHTHRMSTIQQILELIEILTIYSKETLQKWILETDPLGRNIGDYLQDYEWDQSPVGKYLFANLEVPEASYIPEPDDHMETASKVYQYLFANRFTKDAIVRKVMYEKIEGRTEEEKKEMITVNHRVMSSDDFMTYNGWT